MTREESLVLLQARWPVVEDIVHRYGGVPKTDLQRDDLVVHVRILSNERTLPNGARGRDPYVFRLDFSDYDEHAPRICLCDPDDRSKVGRGRQFYPNIDGNTVFNHENFFCMPGDRRCYEQNNHREWMQTQHYHPDVVIGSLFELIRSPNYRGRV